MFKYMIVFESVKVFINPFHTTDTFLYTVKTPERLWFTIFSGGIERDKKIWSYLDTSTSGNTSLFLFVF